MDVVEYTVKAYEFLLTLIGVILDAMVGPLGIVAAVVAALVIGCGLYLVLLRRPSRRLP